MNLTRHPAPVITTTQADGFARWAACCQDEIRAAQYTPTDAALWAYVLVFFRGFVIVALTAMNVRQIAAGHVLSAFVVGACISSVWWFNSRRAAHDDARFAWIAYALGAGCGTVAGMTIGGMI